MELTFIKSSSYISYIFNPISFAQIYKAISINSSLGFLRLIYETNSIKSQSMESVWKLILLVKI